MTPDRARRSRAGAAQPSRYPRSLRVNEVLRQVVAEELERLADADERLRLLTVTSVDTAPDLRTATVYVGTLDPDAAEALDERRGQLQRHLGSQVRLKRTPRLQFAPDPGVSAGERVEAVLRRIATTSAVDPEDGAREPTGPAAGAPSTDEPGRPPPN